LKLLGVYRYQQINAIDCALVPTLPELLSTICGNQTVSITSADCVLEIVAFKGFPALCTIAIDDAGEYPHLSGNIEFLGVPS
jgi:hypothetical protein